MPFRPALRALLPLLLLFGCASEDARLPANLYEEALKLNREGHSAEAHTLLSRVIRDYPDSEAAKQAKRDIFLIETFASRETAERRRQVRASMKRVVDALTRHKGKVGEYPTALESLVPEYLDRLPETPWGHPFFYKPYVQVPVEQIPVKRGPARQRLNTKLDGYYLACFGTDLAPGGKDLAGDLLVKDGEAWDQPTFPPLPQPQPAR